MTIKEQDLKMVLDALFDQVLVINQDFIIEHANGSCAKALGYADPGEIVGRHCHEVSHGLDHPCSDSDHPCPLTLVLKHAKPLTVEHVHQDSGGNPVHVEIRTIPLPGEDGTVSRVAEILRDITAERLLQEQLNQTILESEQIFQRAADGILVLDREFRIKEANRIASDLLGIPSDDLQGQDFRRFMIEQDVSFLEGMCLEVESDGAKRLSSEMQLVAASGENREVEVHISATDRPGHGRIFAGLRDITHQKRVENKLFEATRKFQKIAEMGEDAILVLDDTVQRGVCQLHGAGSHGLFPEGVDGAGFPLPARPGGPQVPVGSVRRRPGR
jgi:PAS domain S-box-containing protein